MAQVYLPAQLRHLSHGSDRVSVDAATIGELIDALDVRFPGLRDALLEKGELRASIAVSIDGDITTGALFDSVGPKSEVHFVPALGGG